MGKEITIKLPDGTVISVPEGSSKETIRTVISLVTGKGIDIKEEEKITKITTHNELLSASKKERIASIVRNHFPENDWFTSNDIEILYSKIFMEGIKISTVSTTLARMADEGLLKRKGNVSQRYYAITQELKEKYSVLDIHSIPELISK
ncbi:MAG: hypothetical protein ACTSQE_10510 [Candidatus Heimdallarchaeaceae archaeon]